MTRKLQMSTFNDEELPHHGPISPDCPVECLHTVLSLHALKRLVYVHDGLSTVAAVVKLCMSGELGDIPGIGARRISEIKTALVFAGLNIARNEDGRTTGSAYPQWSAWPSMQGALSRFTAL